MRWAARTTEAWNRFWFAPESATNLAAARILVCAHSLWLLLSRDFGAIAGVPVLWSGVPAISRWSYVLLPGQPSLEAALQGLAVALLVSALLGLWPRACCFLAGLLIFHLAPYETMFRDAAPYGRGLTLAAPALLILAASPSADALVPWRRPAAPDRRSGDYGWALRLLQLLVCQIYLFAAWAKLVTAGPDWGSATNMRRWLLWGNVDPTMGAFQAPGMWLAERPSLLLGLLGLGTLVIEWGFVAVLFLPRLRRWVIPATLAFNLVLIVTMNAHVPETWLILLFVNWSALRAARGASAAARDGDGARGAVERPVVA